MGTLARRIACKADDRRCISWDDHDSGDRMADRLGSRPGYSGERGRSVPLYQRHELLSMAVQGLFWAALTWLCDEKKAYTPSRTAFVRDFAGRFETALPESTASARFTDIVATWATALPPLESWRDEGHEIGELEALEAAQKARDVDG